jgi:excisionase family DNA binding protein
METTTRFLEKLLTVKQAADILNVSTTFLNIDRIREKRVPFIKIGKLVRYRPSDLEAFINGLPAQETTPAPVCTEGKRRGRPRKVAA